MSGSGAVGASMLPPMKCAHRDGTPGRIGSVGADDVDAMPHAACQAGGRISALRKAFAISAASRCWPIRTAQCSHLSQPVDNRSLRRVLPPGAKGS